MGTRTAQAAAIPGSMMKGYAMGLDCNHMAIPDTEDDAAGFAAFPKGGGGLQPRRVNEVGHDRAPSHASEPNHSAPGWNTNYVDQGETIAPRRRPDPYRVSGGPAAHSYKLI